MLNRLAIVVAAALTSAAAGAPDPAKPAAEASKPDNQPITLLASADHVGTPNQPAEPPKKARAMRVTTCRCGDQAVEPADEPKDR